MDLSLIFSDTFFYCLDYISLLVLVGSWGLMTRLMDGCHINYQLVLGKMKPLKGFVFLSLLALGICCVVEACCSSLLSGRWSRYAPAFLVIVYPLLMVIIMYYVDLLGDLWFLLKEMLWLWPDMSFRKAFTADLLTSVSKVFSDIPCTWYTLFHGPKNGRVPWNDDPLCYSNSIVFPLLIMIPYALRFFQCLRVVTLRSYINAVKFLFLLLFLVFQSLRAVQPGKWDKEYVAFGVISSTCSILWNFFDWDIVGRWKLVELWPNNRHILLRLAFYTWFFLVESVARFIWYFKMISPKKSWIVSLFGLLELVRRLHWMYMRLEREVRLTAEKNAKLPISHRPHLVGRTHLVEYLQRSYDTLPPRGDIDHQLTQSKRHTLPKDTEPTLIRRFQAPGSIRDDCV